MNSPAIYDLVSRFVRFVRNWRARLSPVVGIGVGAVFLYWIWFYRSQILSTFWKVGGFPLVGIVTLLIVSILLTIAAFTTLVREKGYVFSFADAYHSLNLSQLASMLPGGVWGYAGLAAALWSKGIAKSDSVIVILLYTVISLSACVIVGISSLASILGWGYAIICLLPFLLLIFGRGWLDELRERYLPDTSALPSKKALIKVLLLSLLIWIVSSGAFTWLLYTSEGLGVIPFWVATGAYATGYLGGYITLLAPSGLGVTEGIVSILLSPYLGASRVLAIAISFRLIQTLIIWCNILITVIVTSGRHGTEATKGLPPK